MSYFNIATLHIFHFIFSTQWTDQQ